MKAEHMAGALKPTHKLVTGEITEFSHGSITTEDEQIGCHICNGSGSADNGEICRTCFGEGEMPESIFNNKFN